MNSQAKNQYTNVFDMMTEWRIKNKFLKDQIVEIEQRRDFKIAPLVSFIFKSQLIEWEIKQLITELDLYSRFSNNHKVSKRKIITPYEMDEQKWTLGKLILEFKKYKYEFLKDLQIQLEAFKDLRNKFIHCLFNLGSIEDLIKKAEQGLKLANNIINDIEQVNNFLEKHDSFNTK